MFKLLTRKRRPAKEVQVNMEAGGRVLIIIDLQEAFITQHSTDLPERTKVFVERVGNKFDTVIRCAWVNDPTSNFYTELEYRGCYSKAEQQLCIPEVGGVIMKRTAYSCVTEQMTDLLRPTDDIYICGLETDACILASCFDLFNRNYKFTVIKDLVSTKCIEVQDAVFTLMQRNFSRNVLKTVDEICTELRID